MQEDQLKGDRGTRAEGQQQRGAGRAYRPGGVSGADQHHCGQRERQTDQSGQAQVLTLEQPHTDGQRGGDQRGHRGEHVHRADGQGLVEQGERGGRRNTRGSAPGQGLRAERRAEERPQQQLDHERGRGGDHHGAQDMGLSGAETAEEVGASVGE